MADATNVAALKGDLFNVATLSGRIHSSRLHDRVTYTEITLPAPDQFSHPQVVEVRSKKSLGRDGEDVQVGVRIGGMRKKFDRKPDQYGEVQTGHAVRVWLDAIEA